MATFLASSCAADPRIATPEATVESVLRATHLLGPVASSSRTRFGRPIGEPPPPRPQPDLATLALCFWDFDRDDPASRGMADFVAGMLAAGQGSFRFEVGRSSARVRTVSRTVFMRRSHQGFHIDLAESVPPEIRRGLRSSAHPLGPARDEP